MIPADPNKPSPVGMNLELMSNLDGTSNTVLLVEVNPDAAVPWTQPSDYEIEKGTLADRLRGVWRKRIVIAMCDGVIREISSDVSDEQLRPLLLTDDGAAIDWEALHK